MGISLNGLTPAGTYPGLIKTGDNTAISGTPKVLSDGNGNDLPMAVSTTGVNFTNQLQQGGVAVPTASQVAAKQDTLVSGTNIKTINGTSVLGSGNIVIPTTNPSGVAGAIQFSNGSAFASDAANLFWDDTNNRLGIGTNVPTNNLSIVGADSFNNLGVYGASGKLQIRGYLNSTYGTLLESTTSGGVLMPTTISASKILLLDGQVGINTTSTSAQLHIKGSGSTSATTSLLVQNSVGAQTLKIQDDGTSTIGTSGSGVFTINSLYGFINMSGGYLGYGFSASEAWTYRNGSNVSQFKIGTTGNAIFNGTLSLGNGSDPVASAQVEITSTTKGFLPPRMTTTQKNAIASPAAGLVVYDSTTNKLQCYNGSTWNDLF
jgi:hypothetical protein